MNFDITDEVEIRTSRSGGKGGQHVNKVETRVELRWIPESSLVFTPEQKIRLTTKLANRINKEGVLIVKCDEDRTQLANRTIAFKKLGQLLENALKEEAVRKATRVPRAVKEKRLAGKKKRAEVKNLRKKVIH